MLGWAPSRLAQRAKLHSAIVQRAESLDGEPPITVYQHALIRDTLERFGIGFAGGQECDVRCGRWGRPKMMTADAVRLTTTDLLQGRLGLAPLECSRCNRRAQPRTWEVAAMCRIALLTSIVALVLACTLELTSVAGAQEVKPRAVRPPKNAAQPAPKPPVGAASPEDCGTNSAIYWAGSGPKVHVIRQGTLTERKPLDPTSPLTQMVVLEVRILDKLAATYGPSFESMRRSGPPNQVEEETGSAIKWLGNLTGVPRSLSIIAEDGSEVVATLRFEGCGSRRPNERRHSARNQDEGQGHNPQRDPATLPRGAIQ